MAKQAKWAVIVGERYICQPGSKKLGWSYERRWADFVASIVGGRVIDADLFLAMEDLPGRQVMAATGTLGNPSRLTSGSNHANDD